METFKYLFSYEVIGSKATCEELELGLLLYLSGISVLTGLTFYTSHTIGFQSKESLNSVYDYVIANFSVLKEKDATLQFVIFSIDDKNEKRTFSNVKEA